MIILSRGFTRMGTDFKSRVVLLFQLGSIHQRESAIIRGGLQTFCVHLWFLFYDFPLFES